MSTLVQCQPRAFSREEFDRAYHAAIATVGSGDVLEVPDYYRVQRPRYRRTLEHLAALNLPRPARILEIGGGQIAILAKQLFDDASVVGDINPEYAAFVKQFGIDWVRCNLLEDDLPEDSSFDAVVLCEVIEHLPVPPYTVLNRVRQWLKPGGKLLVTTPNLYRIRNVLRLAFGINIFDHYRFSEPDVCMGHQLEYSADHLAWQIEQAGFNVDYVKQEQMVLAGHSLFTTIARAALSPAFLVPRWRDGLIACGTKPQLCADS